MSAKERNTLKLLKYLANPENEWPTRVFLSRNVLGYAQETSIHKAFTADELDEIDLKALEMRRKKYAASLAKVDRGLLKKAAEGDSHAAKLVYQRFEGWIEKLNVSVDQLDRLIDIELARLTSPSKVGDAGTLAGDEALVAG